LDGQPFIDVRREVIIRRELDPFFRDSGVGIAIVMQFDNIQSIRKRSPSVGNQHPAGAYHAGGIEQNAWFQSAACA